MGFNMFLVALVIAAVWFAVVYALYDFLVSTERYVYTGKRQALLVNLTYKIKYRLSGPKGKIEAAIELINYRLMVLRQLFGPGENDKMGEVIETLKSKRKHLRKRLEEIMQLEALSGLSVISGPQPYDYLFPNSLEHMINERIKEIKHDE